MTQTLERGGAAGLLDVRQAEQLVETAAETIPETERQIALQEDLISTLTGENPHDIPRGLRITEQPLPPEIPPGLPSELLERRPDIRARRSAARRRQRADRRRASAVLPEPAADRRGRLGERAPGAAVQRAPDAWSFSAPVTQPIFTAGRLRSNLRLAEAQQQQALLTYRQTIQQAFRQVSDALIAYTKYREFREHQERLTTAAEEAANLSDMRYRGGAASYLEVLTNQTNYFSAELNLARARLNERLSLVQVYNALGGGWQQ